MTALYSALPEQLALLLVDDHRIFLDGLALALGPLSPSLQIRTAQTAAEAETWLQSQDFDLILLDLRLPDMPGLELLQRWQRAGRMKLKAANVTYPDINPADGQTVEIWGVVVAAIKQFAT